jgi:minor fimbrial subunit
MKQCKYLVPFLVLLVVFFLQNNAHAVQCSTSVGSPVTYDFSFIMNNPDSSQNKEGYTTGWQEQSSSGTYMIGGACQPKNSVLYTALPATELIYAFTDNGTAWYNINGNDYLQVASQIYVYDAKGSSGYRGVPFVDVNNNCDPAACGDPTSRTGSQVRINFRIKRPFVGISNIPRMPVFYLYGNQGGPGQGQGSPLVIGYITSSVVVPQSCMLNAGQIVSVDFGVIPSSAFKVAGEKADGISPIAKTISVSCKGIDANQTLTMRVQADNVSGNAIVSSNVDVGYIITDIGNNILTPNDVNSTFPFMLDSSLNSQTTVTVYPVSITGQKPQPGNADANAYLRVDFE